MKIVHFIDTRGVGGAETVMIQCVMGLKNFGHQVEIWHLGSAWVSESCREKGIKDRVIWAPNFYKKSYLLPVALLLLIVQSYRYRVDIIHSHIYTAVASIAVIAPFLRARHIGTLHDTWFMENRYALRKLLLRMAVFFGTKLVVISEDMRAKVENKIGIKADAMSVVYNGTDATEFVPDEKIDRNNKTKVICVARLIPRKRIDLLLDASRELKQKGYCFDMTVVGGGELEGRLREIVSESELSDTIKLLGERKDIPLLLRSSNIFVLPSDDEGLPCSIIEAMASGLPVVASDVGGVRELVVDDENGFLFPAGNGAELFGALEKLIRDSEVQKKLGRRSREMFEQHFSTDVMASSYLEVYEE